RQEQQAKHTNSSTPPFLHMQLAEPSLDDAIDRHRLSTECSHSHAVEFLYLLAAAGPPDGCQIGESAAIGSFIGSKIASGRSASYRTLLICCSVLVFPCRSFMTIRIGVGTPSIVATSKVSVFHSAPATS